MSAKKYKHFDSKNIKIFIERNLQFGAMYFFKISIAFRSDNADFDNQLIIVADFENKKDYFQKRQQAENAAFKIAHGIENLCSQKIDWQKEDVFNVESGKIYASLYKRRIDLVYFDTKMDCWFSISGDKNCYIDYLAEFSF